MIRYLGGLSPTKVALWCYLVWYLVIVAFYFDASVILWLSSLGISALIGIALLLSTARPGHQPDGWVVFRLFLIPFCVSSYSALIKGKGFIVLFPPNLYQLGVATSACVGFILLHIGCRRASQK